MFLSIYDSIISLLSSIKCIEFIANKFNTYVNRHKIFLIVYIDKKF